MCEISRMGAQRVECMCMSFFLFFLNFLPCSDFTPTVRLKGEHTPVGSASWSCMLPCAWYYAFTLGTWYVEICNCFINNKKPICINELTDDFKLYQIKWFIWLLPCRLWAELIDSFVLGYYCLQLRKPHQVPLAFPSKLLQLPPLTTRWTQTSSFK